MLSLALLSPLLVDSISGRFVRPGPPNPWRRGIRTSPSTSSELAASVRLHRSVRIYLSTTRCVAFLLWFLQVCIIAVSKQTGWALLPASCSVQGSLHGVPPCSLTGVDESRVPALHAVRVVAAGTHHKRAGCGGAQPQPNPTPQNAGEKVIPTQRDGRVKPSQNSSQSYNTLVRGCLILRDPTCPLMSMLMLSQAGQ